MAAVFGDNGDEVDGETMIDKWVMPCCHHVRHELNNPAQLYRLGLLLGFRVCLTASDRFCATTCQ